MLVLGFFVLALAMSDWIGIASILVSTMVAVGLFYVGRRVSQLDKVKEERDQAVKDLARAEVNTMTAELQTAIKLLSQQVGQLNARLDSGDGKLEDLLERSHSIKLQEAFRDGEQQRWILTTFATKEDMTSLNGRIDALRQTIIESLADRVQRRAVSA